MSTQPTCLGQVTFESQYVERGEYMLLRGTYGNGVPALLLDDLSGEPVATLTVNLPGDLPREGHVWIKTWSENEGVLEAAQAAGIVGEHVQRRTVGPHDCWAAEVPVTHEGWSA